MVQDGTVLKIEQQYAPGERIKILVRKGMLQNPSTEGNTIVFGERIIFKWLRGRLSLRKGKALHAVEAAAPLSE